MNDTIDTLIDRAFAGLAYAEPAELAAAMVQGGADGETAYLACVAARILLQDVEVKP